MGQCMAIIKGEDQQPQQPPQQSGAAASNAYPGAGGQRNNHAAPSASAVSHAPHVGASHSGHASNHSAPTFNGPRSWPPSSSAGDPQRFEAGVHAKRRGELMAQSQAAWNRGDKAAAKKLSDEGKAEGVLMDKANAAAAEAYFADNNRGKGMGEIDLHGLHVSEAIERVEARIHQCEAQRLPQLIVIVGRGNHSEGGVRKIKPAMEKLIADHRLRVAVGAPNEGCLTIQFGHSEQGFITQGAGHTKSAEGAGCAQM